MALKLAYYKQGDVEILNPVTYGDQLTNGPSRSGTATRWTPEAFKAALAELADANTRDGFVKLLAHGEAKGDHPFWGSGSVPGMSYYYKVAGKEAPVWAMYLRPTGAVFAISFGSIAHVSHDGAAELLATLAGHPAFGPHVKHVDPVALNKYPNIPASVLSDAGNASFLLGAIDQLIG